MRLFLAFVLICGSAMLAHGALLDLPKDRRVTRDEPCQVEVVHHVKPAAPIKISRRSALYVVRHVHKACLILLGADFDRSRSDSIRSDLYSSIIEPIYRTHPNIASAASGSAAQRLFRATPHDIGRTTARRVEREFKRLGSDLSKLSQDALERSADESAAKTTLGTFLDTSAELTFAGHIAFDAYPDLFAESFDDIPIQTRTAESDEGFRAAAPPLGSVKLSDAALALIRSFMQAVRRKSTRDQVAVILWAQDQKSKGPGDPAWSSQGPGWALGTYWKSMVPPEVIDTVRGVEIVFRAYDPSTLAGKTIDAKAQKLFVRD